MYSEHLKAYRIDPVIPKNIFWGIHSNTDAPVEEWAE